MAPSSRGRPWTNTKTKTSEESPNPSIHLFDKLESVLIMILCLSLFHCALLCVLSSFAVIFKRKRELVALLLLSYVCLVSVNVLWLFLTVHGLVCDVWLWYFLIIPTTFSTTINGIEKYAFNNRGSQITAVSDDLYNTLTPKTTI